MEEGKRPTFSLVILMINMLIAMIGIGLIIPIMPRFLEEFGVGGQSMGYLVAAFAFTQFFFSPLGGELSDKYGRKFMIIIGLACFTASQFIFAAGTEMWVLYVSRLLGGMGAAFMIPPMMAYVADITTIEKRAKGMGMLGAAMSLGFVIGPGIGGFLADFGLRVPFYSSAVIACIATVTSLLFLPETLSKTEQIKARNTKKKQENIFQQLARSFKAPYFMLLVLVFTLAFGLSNFETVIGLFVDLKFGFTPKDISIIITAGALLGVIIQAAVVDRMIRYFGERKVMIMTFILAATSMILMLFVKGFFIVLIVALMFFTATSLVRPALNTLLSKMAGDEQGYVAGMNNAYMSIGNMIGPAIAGTLFDINMNIPYIFGAMILLASVMMLIRIKAAKTTGNTQAAKS
ncbi:MFS transporter [Bacillus chungangensis]|uniref:DHA1 family multidrug resistance protein-like MFS transporter n=1 Tax=Bacillus chungangensis TaxID=587633 RepID=A0ABT9WWC5_9BACI|nr:MFS transporter [Bacillus chungangensis]MDQ0177182.1 DHA1 family multidrug resistance protein-like MFS transporter [Bacillus chungangensis]